MSYEYRSGGLVLLCVLLLLAGTATAVDVASGPAFSAFAPSPTISADAASPAISGVAPAPAISGGVPSPAVYSAISGPVISGVNPGMSPRRAFDGFGGQYSGGGGYPHGGFTGGRAFSGFSGVHLFNGFVGHAPEAPRFAPPYSYSGGGPFHRGPMQAAPGFYVAPYAPY